MGEFRTAPYLSAAERGFGFSLSQTHSKAIQFTWRYEAYWVMLWALGFVAKLARPDSQCDVARAVSILRGLGHDKFMSQAKLRPPAEVLDAADLIYRYHWAVREYHQLRGQEPPAKLNADVVMERHHALNWLIGYGNGDWDSVDTST